MGWVHGVVLPRRQWSRLAPQNSPFHHMAVAARFWKYLPFSGSHMDRLESMATLLAAVETGSLSAASRKLGMPLATVSRKVSELEAHLRTRLLNRTSRRLTLTDAGRAYVEACKRILETSAKPSVPPPANTPRRAATSHHRADRVRPPACAAGRRSSFSRPTPTSTSA